MALLEIKNLNFTYNGSDKKALEDIHMTVEKGDLILLCGESGCGKTTLLKLLKRQLRPFGQISGEILYNGKNIDDIDERTSVAEIGYVMQNPESQIVTDKVWHELAFGLESLGTKNDVVRRRVAEVCGFFGIGAWYRKKTCELSGGQKQLLSLASVMAMNPSLLILDEPTAQLDPIAASEFLASLRKINEELGVTVMIAEHRLDEVFSMATKVVLMDKAKIFLCETPRGIGENLAKDEVSQKLSLGLPAATRLFHALGGNGKCPLTVKEGKDFIEKNYKSDITSLELPSKKQEKKATALEIRGGYFRYERNTPDILSGLDISVYDNEIFCILGSNGAGKTTLLRVLSGLRPLYKGSYTVYGKKLKPNTAASHKIAALPQDPQNLFVMSTVYDDLLEVTKFYSLSKEDGKKAVLETAEKLGISHLLKSHPYDLSGGEQQKAGLAKILLADPKIILLDEPTKGLDAYSKKKFADLLLSLKHDGKTIVIVTHDVEFAAEYADRCAMFFDGGIVSAAESIEFFSSNSYYTTAAARIMRPKYQNAVTVEAAAKLCLQNGKKAENE